MISLTATTKPLHLEKFEEDTKWLQIVSMYDQKQLMERICILEKETAQLKTQLKEKDVIITNLTELLQHKISEYSQLIEEEQQSHEQTEGKLKQAETLAEEKLQQLQENRKEFEEKAEQLKKLHEEKLAAVLRKSASEISCRDEKISKLKQQISEILQGKSCPVFVFLIHKRERQRQIYELKKEVTRVSEEASRLQRELTLQKSLKQTVFQYQITKISTSISLSFLNVNRTKNYGCKNKNRNCRRNSADLAALVNDSRLECKSCKSLPLKRRPYK
ncbi:uncharacterized protein [Chiloscyllium punctatum]|uniref:uncharacterized protein n=1 Tax=Chiloscyllium punctatum TaxID=137246 RepID=UPI003B63E5D4